LLYMREKEQLKVDFEKQILESKLEIQEQTFRNISQEIHDNIGQVLSLAKLTINTMDVNDTTILKTKIDNSKSLVGKAIEDLRNLSRNLNTEYITDVGLDISIENELKLLHNVTQYKIEVQTEGEPYRLQHQQELIIFRIFQESLQNIIKHADPQNIIVKVESDKTVLISIKDDGKGFNTDNAFNGNGLLNMQYRAKKAGYLFNIFSTGKGTEITLQKNHAFAV